VTNCFRIGILRFRLRSVTFRRAVAFSAAILILRLGFVAGESRCVPGHDAPSQHHKHRSENPTPPTVPVCCQALTSCSLIVDVTRPAAARVERPTGTRPQLAAIRTQGQLTSGPEAPPPELALEPVVVPTSPAVAHAATLETLL